METKQPKDGKKLNIVNIACIVVAMVCIGLTFWGNLKNDGVLTTDAYISVIATLIGICVTIMVGVQILNYIEFKEVKRKVEKVDSLELQSSGDRERISELTSLLSTYTSNILWGMSKIEDDLRERAMFLVLAIIIDGLKDEKKVIGNEENIEQQRFLISEASRCILDRHKVLYTTVSKMDSIGQLEKFIIRLDVVETSQKLPDYYKIIELRGKIIKRLKVLALIKNNPSPKKHS